MSDDVLIDTPDARGCCCCRRSPPRAGLRGREPDGAIAPTLVADALVKRVDGRERGVSRKSQPPMLLFFRGRVSKISTVKV